VTHIQKDESLPKIEERDNYYKKCSVIDRVRVIVGFQRDHTGFTPVHAFPDSDQYNT
jgi:hypothetical protein